MSTRVRLVAGVILALSLAFPLLSVPAGLERTPRSYRWPLEQASGDWSSVILVFLAFLWPFGILVLRHLAPSRAQVQRIVILLAEPVCGILSVAFILFAVSLTLEFRQVFVIFFLPVSARAEIGTYTAVAGNAIYLAAWVWDRLASLEFGADRLAA